MGIQKDAGELLLYVYEKYKYGRLVSSEEIISDKKWEHIQAKNAFNYLKDRELIDGIFFLGGNFLIRKIYPNAIDLAEDKAKFKEIFG